MANAPIEGADSALTSHADVPAVWWKLYDDPVLNGLVDEALQSNTDLRVAAANLARSREALGVAQAQGGFSGKTSAVFERAQESAEQYLLTEKLPVVNEGDVGISVAYEIDLFGKLRRGVEAAQADADAAAGRGAISRASQWSPTWWRAYVEQCSAAEELKIAQQSLALQRQRVDVSRRLRDGPRQSDGSHARANPGRYVVRGHSALHRTSQDRAIPARGTARARTVRLAARGSRLREAAANPSTDSRRRRRRAAEAPARRARSRASTGGIDGAYRRCDRRAVSDREHRRIGGFDGRSRRSRHVADSALGASVR